MKRKAKRPFNPQIHDALEAPNPCTKKAEEIEGKREEEKNEKEGDTQLLYPITETLDSYTHTHTTTLYVPMQTPGPDVRSTSFFRRRLAGTRSAHLPASCLASRTGPSTPQLTNSRLRHDPKDGEHSPCPTTQNLLHTQVWYRPHCVLADMSHTTR
ncbi:hypothetical protein M406DRAFT_98217 [Cryphonectria parasitica EP155]|uniref:Uncharacterized protein n=1 Tax=Cryphonectria parasitica (strain ATCC 38755 / EP155) TaxID=660469 RepID=A0A9P5CNH0_CRYP1|nr:uncharacterized protein M406DRAFT_98217 [Cryphonectria parasitica EP155]KAF3765138.1 hypothetical protein M406DRAFT_98217 [Cryphonectria parasitica EP155]